MWVVAGGDGGSGGLGGLGASEIAGKWRAQDKHAYVKRLCS